MNATKLILMLIATVISFSTIAAQLNLDDPHRLESDRLRDNTSKPDKILSLMDINEGMVIADVLGGGGYYSELLSQLVGKSGKVFLHNNQAYMPYVGDELKKRFSDNRLSNVVQHNHETDDLQFKANSLDAVLFVMGYHDMYHVGQGWKINKSVFLQQLYGAMKVGAKMLVIDHSAPIGSRTKYSQDLHRIAEDFVIEDMRSEGFKLVKQSELLRNEKDSKLISPFAPEIRRKTDRFVLVFEKI